MSDYKRKTQASRSNSKERRSSSEVLGEMMPTDFDLEEISAAGLDEAATRGARLILQIALEREVEEFLGRLSYERSEAARPGYRNGHRKRTLTCGSGSFELAIPKIKGADAPFHIQSVKAYQRVSDKLLDAIPHLFVEGLSNRDFERSLGELWTEAGLSRSSISRANKELH